ncbi:MAG: DoxX family rane protein [Mucilaginibacter sp.]|nr:DoxX family rane protein [Mucilaginibacter sp.]
MKIAVIIIRSLLGLIFLVFGLNFFFHFMPMTAQPTGKAGAFSGGLFGAGYFFPYMKVIETAGGLFLLINRYTTFFLLLLFPITVNIFLFHAFLAPSGLPLGALMLLMHLFLGIAYRKYYSPIFTNKPVIP